MIIKQIDNMIFFFEKVTVDYEIIDGGRLKSTRFSSYGTSTVVPTREGVLS